MGCYLIEENFSKNYDFMNNKLVFNMTSKLACPYIPF